MRRSIFLAVFCFFINFFLLFGNPFVLTANAQPSGPPIANDDGIYVVKEPFPDGTFTLDVPAPEALNNDWRELSYNIQSYPIGPGPWHNSGNTCFIGGNGFYGGRISYKSASGYFGIDSCGYKIHYNPSTTLQDTARVFVFVIPRDGAENAGYMCPPSSKGSSGGQSLPVGAVGEPVNVTNGNMWIEQSDYALPGIGENIEIKRFYNSIIQRDGLFGFGWSTKYNESLWIYPEDEHQNGDETINHQMLRLNMPDGRAVYFGREKRSEPYKAALMGFYGQIVKNTDNTFTLNFKDGRVHHFSAGGKLLWQKDRNGNQTTLSYNGSGHLTSVTDAFGRILTFTPNTNGMIASTSDSLGTIATYEYFTGTTRLKTVTYNDGSKYKFEYTNITVNNQPKTYLTTVKDALDNVLETHAYDSSGRATTSEKHGGVEKYTLDYSNWGSSTPYTLVKHRKNINDPEIETKYYFDKSKGRNLITKTEGICGCGGSGSEITTYEYDIALNLTKKTDALNRQTTYTYDNNGNRLTMTDVLGTETYTYNSFGEILTRTDRMSGVWTNTYDANGNLLTAEDALDNTTTLTYTTLGQIETITDARNNTTTLTYDTQGRLTEVEDANNKTTTYAYDSRARLTSITNAINQTTEFEYDLNNRLKKVIHPDTNFITYTYDLAGRMTEMTDERDNTTEYEYDNAYRLTSVTDALTHEMQYSYDLMSNLTSQTDALGNVTNYEYDDFNRLKKVIYPAATTNATRLEEEFEYNTVGKVKKRIDTANRETLYDYDNAHRLIEITDALNQVTEFEYNARSQMTKVTDALNQEYVFTYDALGRQLTQTRASSTMAYEYDEVGNRTERTDYTGRVTNYVYDNLNRLTNINYVNQTGDNATYAYDDLSRLTSASNYAGTVTFEYDNRNRISNSSDVFGRTVFYEYDENGNRILMKFESNVSIVSVGANSGNIIQHYLYDAANRLTETTESDYTFTFGYDDANRLTQKTLPNGISTVYEYDGMSRLKRLKHEDASNNILFDNNYGYNPANQINQIAGLTDTRDFGYDNLDRLTSVLLNNSPSENYNFNAVGNRLSSHLSSSYTHQPFNRLTATQTASYVYNANGNLTSKTTLGNTTDYVWDYENRLRQAVTPSTTVNYEYDALGRRVKRTKGDSITEISYDGLDVVFEADEDYHFIKYTNALGIDNKLSYREGVEDNYYFLQDHLGSTIRLTDSSGMIYDQIGYDGFGNPSNSFRTRFQYTGREYDAATGLYFYRARWYDSQVGRFISEDPIGFVGGDVNLYGYVGNNSLNLFDPLGLQDTDVIILNSPPFNNPTPVNRNTNCPTNECQQRVDQMINILNQTRDWMDANGYRVPNASGNWNNIRSTGNGLVNLGSNFAGFGDVVNPYGGCQWQASQLMERLNVSGYDFEYGHDFILANDVNPRYFTFPMTDTPLTTHKWVKAIPRNPNYPKLKLDTWNNSWEVIP